MGVVAVGLALSSLAALVAGGVVAGLGQGLNLRAGLSAVNAAAPADHRAEVASSFFTVAYVALSVPVVGVGLLAELTSLRAAGLIFAALVALLALSVLLLVGQRNPNQSVESRQPNDQHKRDTRLSRSEPETVG
jgi:hypothetical protein